MTHCAGARQLSARSSVHIDVHRGWVCSASSSSSRIRILMFLTCPLCMAHDPRMTRHPRDPHCLTSLSTSFISHSYTQLAEFLFFVAIVGTPWSKPSSRMLQGPDAPICPRLHDIMAIIGITINMWPVWDSVYVSFSPVFSWGWFQAAVSADTFLRCTRVAGRSQCNAALSIIMKPTIHHFLFVFEHIINRRTSLDSMSRSNLRCSHNCAWSGTASTLQLAPATDRFYRCVCAWGGQYQRLSRRVCRHLDSGGLPTGRSHLGTSVHRSRRHFEHLPQRMLQVGRIRTIQHARYWRGAGAFDANLRFERIRCARLKHSSALDTPSRCRGKTERRPKCLGCLLQGPTLLHRLPNKVRHQASPVYPSVTHATR
jgi:hypothetical protein